MNTLLSYRLFKKMRDEGKFSKKFEGKHRYFLYLEQDETKDMKKDLEIYIKDDSYLSPPPAPRYRKNSFADKHFNTDNMPNKYHIQGK